ncbi:MAG TPA: hypothetical protein VGB91_16140 [Rhizomicrobium sp.]
MSRVTFAFALAAIFALAACYPPVTTHPVGTTAGLAPDPALTGLWKGTNSDGKPGYFHFLQQSDGTTVALIVEAGPKAEDWNVATLTTARLGANRVMNATLQWTNDKPETAPPGTVPVLYRIDARGTLTLALMDETAVKAAIAAGRIKGTVGTGEFGDAIITADPKALDALFASPGAVKLFAEPFFTLRKVE